MRDENLTESEKAKADLYKFRPMPDPAEQWPVGSPEWAERLACRLRLATRSIGPETAVAMKAAVIDTICAKVHPWEVWPAGKPFGTPEAYCKAVTGLDWGYLLYTAAKISGGGGFTELVMDYEIGRIMASEI